MAHTGMVPILDLLVGRGACGVCPGFSQAKGLKANRVGFELPGSRGHGGKLAGANRRHRPQEKSIGMDTLEHGLQATLKADEENASAPPAATSLSPLAVVALSALGIVVGCAIVSQVSPWGSLGRYQFIHLRDSTLVRIDTTSGALSACYYKGRNIGQPATCFPWSQTSRDFLPAADAGTAQ